MNSRSYLCEVCDANVLEAMEERMKTTPEDARPITGWAMSLLQTA